MSMVADGFFELDGPVERWLPELAHPRVLVSPDAPGPRESFSYFWEPLAAAV